MLPLESARSIFRKANLRSTYFNSISSYYVVSIMNLKVIDDEKKTQELEANKDGPSRVKTNKGSAWDAPYPEGVKKHKIRRIPDAPQAKSTNEEENVKTNGKYRK